MPELTAVEWTMQADVNDETFTLAGLGTADLTSGATDLVLSASPRFPDGFDPALSQFMCNFTLAGYTAVPQVEVGLRHAVERTLFVRPRRMVDITDASGELVVHLEALTTMTVTDDRIVVTNDMTGFSRLPADVAAVVGRETLLPEAPGTATGLARYAVELVDGQQLEGLTLVPYRFDRAVMVTSAVRSLSDQDCQRTSATEVTLRAASRWQELSLRPAAERTA